MEIATATTSRKYLAIGHRLQAAIALARLDLDEAREQARRAIVIADRIRNPTLRWKTRTLLGDALLRSGRTDEARAAFEAAAEIVADVAAGIADAQLRRSLERSAAVVELRERLA
jgi:predicted negative regulator of RcsB-dependent stress response